jgi:hypothetical protein
MQGILGPLYGNQDRFRGLALIIDTYDNDGTVKRPQGARLPGQGKHPYLSVIVSDGSSAYEHSHENHGQGMEQGGCQISGLRNQVMPSQILVSLNGNTIKVEFAHSGASARTVCLEKSVPLMSQLFLNGGYFGFSAATGDLADNHDVHSLSVRNLAVNPNTAPLTLNNDQYILYGALSRIEAVISAAQGGGSASAENEIRSLRESVDYVKARIGNSANEISGLKSDLIQLQRSQLVCSVRVLLLTKFS